MTHPHIWYPFTQAKTAPEPLKVKSAQGVWLELEDGRKVIDCISSWWVTLHGHANPHIAAAIYAQAQTLEQVIFAGCTHDPAEQLAEKLVQQLPGNLNRVFFSDNGSTAIEVALKMAYQYWVNQGEARSTFLAFEGAYHGDTFGAMAVGARSLFTEVFSDLLFGVDFIPFPATYWNDDQVEAKENDALETLIQKLENHPDRYTALVIEPLVQGAGGMRMVRVEFLQRLALICHQFGVLLIFDEVMTGFGRTGDWFACRKSQVKPDIICLAKGLTGGFLPMAVTVCTEAIYQAFYSDNPLKTLYHGHSYTANPLGCAAALASLELLQRQDPDQGSPQQENPELSSDFASDTSPELTQNSASELHPDSPSKFRQDSDHNVSPNSLPGSLPDSPSDSPLNFRNLEHYHRKNLQRCQAYPQVEQLRVTGTIAAMNWVTSQPGYLNQLSKAIRLKSLEKGLLLRPLGHVLYILPPYCITIAELDRVYQGIEELLGEINFELP